MLWADLCTEHDMPWLCHRLCMLHVVYGASLECTVCGVHGCLEHLLHVSPSLGQPHTLDPVCQCAGLM